MAQPVRSASAPIAPPDVVRRLGDELLLRQLDRRPFGSIHRAQLAGAPTGSQRLLVYLFDSPFVDRAALAAGLARGTQRAPGIQHANLADLVRSGTAEDLPYLAYRHLPGLDLGHLLARAREGAVTIPAEHALFIAARVGRGLAAAAELRENGQPLRHGFLIPDFVRLTPEGDVRVCGREAGVALRDQAGQGRLGVLHRAYLAPEALAGEPPADADDVFSLGALLLELLTGERFEATDEESPSSRIASAVDASGASLAPALANLLRSSLAPRERRIADARAWTAVLEKVLESNQYEPSTFHLGFFLHSWFRDELERERDELRLEAAPQGAAPDAGDEVLVLPPDDGAAGGAAPVRTGAESTSAAPAAVTAATETTASGHSAPPRGGLGAWMQRRPFSSGLGLSLVAALAAAGIYAVLDRPAPPAAAVRATVAASPPAPARSAEPEEALEEVVGRLVEAESKAIEANLRAEYEQEIAALRREVAASREIPRENREPRPPQAPGTAAPEKPPVRPPAFEPPPPAAGSSEPALDGIATPLPVAGIGAELPEIVVPAAPAAARGEAVAPPGGSPAPRAESSPQPEVVPARLLAATQPSFPAAARRLKRGAAVTVRVSVDREGRVVGAELAGPRAGLGFDAAALEAVRSTRWQPATRDGEPVDWTGLVSVDFRP